jgi:hypothetical protein
MKRRVLPSQLSLSLALLTGASGAAASERSFAHTYESAVRSPGESALEPWTGLQLGRERYYSRLDGRLRLVHGLSPHLQLGLLWNFQTVTRDVVVDELTGELGRVSQSEFANVSLEVQCNFTDASADLLGSALRLETTLGPSKSELEANLIFDRRLSSWTVAGHLAAEYQLEAVRNDDGSELETAWVLEPHLGAAYALPRGFTLGLELRAPLALSQQRSALFGGPVLGFQSDRFWVTLGVQPQLLAFSGESPDSHLDLSQRERVNLRLIAGFLL